MTRDTLAKRAKELKSGFTQAELLSLPEAELELLVGALEAQAIACGTVDSIRRSVRQRGLEKLASERDYHCVHCHGLIDSANIVEAAPAGYAHRQCQVRAEGLR